MMAKEVSFQESYMALVEFLMLNKRQVIEHGSRYGLTAMQAMTLFLLDHPRPMHSFKTIFNCDASNVTGLVDGLEQKQLASRFENPDDRRIKMVKILPKGSRVRASLLNKLAGPDSYILSHLSTKEVKQFISLVKKITA
jgi:DNA-binding MarR family transcriptional regulator